VHAAVLHEGGEMKKKIYFFNSLLIVIFLAMSYIPAEPADEKTPGIQKSNEVVVITNPKTPELNLRIVFTEELSIGEVEGDENYMFGKNIFFNTDEDGNFYVSDLDTYRILKYNPDGKYLLSIGRKGQGPGEFGGLSFIGFDKDKNIYTNDAVNNRISFFDKEGKYLRQIRMTERYSQVILNSKNFIIASKFTLSQEGKVQKQTSLYGLFDSEFNLIAELFKDEIEIPLPTGVDASSLGEYIAKIFSISAFRPLAITALADNDYIYLGYPDKYQIDVYSPDGKLFKKINRDYDPIPVSKKDKESFVKMASENLPALLTEDIREKAFQNIKYPKYKPAYQGLALMENGWLAVIVNSIEDEYTLLDIFDQEGKYLAHFKTPVPAAGIRAGLLFFKNGKAYSVVTEDDYRFVKRYSIEIQEYKDGKWVSKK
jgi:hypothetical protein